MKIPDAELEVLKALWELGPSTIRELTGRIYPARAGETVPRRYYATVQKLLERLMAKSCVARSRMGRGHLYEAAIDRTRLIEHRLRETADKLCGGSLTPLLTQLVDSDELSATDPEALRELLTRLEHRISEEENP